MKDIYKNPNLYYIGIPAIIALWPLLAWRVYLPAAVKSIDKERSDYVEAQVIMEEILGLVPERLEVADSNDRSSRFDYVDAFDPVVTLCEISSNGYKINIGMLIPKKRGRPETQTARVALKDVEITKVAKFVSTVKVRWTNLQCEKITLTKKKGFPDRWDADVDFKYYY